MLMVATMLAPALASLPIVSGAGGTYCTWYDPSAADDPAYTVTTGEVKRFAAECHGLPEGTYGTWRYDQTEIQSYDSGVSMADAADRFYYIEWRFNDPGRHVIDFMAGGESVRWYVQVNAPPPASNVPPSCRDPVPSTASALRYETSPGIRFSARCFDSDGDLRGSRFTMKGAQAFSAGGNGDVAAPWLEPALDQAGEYELALSVEDAAGAWSDPVTWRISVTERRVPRPDLLVESIATEPASPTAGEPFVVACRVKNQGMADVPASSYNVLIGTASVELASSTDRPALPAGGGSGTATRTLTVLRAGTETVRCVVDGPRSEVDESDEANNERTRSVTISSLPPAENASLASVSFPSGVKNPGDGLTTSITVKNTGDVARDFWVGLTYLRPDGSTWDIPPREVEALGIEATRTVTFDDVVPADAPLGDYGAVTSVWGGYDADRNVMVRPQFARRALDDAFTVEAPEAEASNEEATMTDVIFPSGTKRPGDTVETTVTVRNTGAIGRDFWVGLTFVRPDGESWDVTPKRIKALASGTTREVTFSATIPTDAPQGSYRGIAAVWAGYDSEHDVMMEPRFDVKERSDAFAVAAPASDAAAITRLSFPSGTFEGGKTVSASTTIENTGGATRDFWVGLTFVGPGSYTWDVPAQRVANLAAGATKTVSFVATIPGDAPAGRYSATTAVWAGYDAEREVMMPPKFDSEEKQAAFRVEVAEVERIEQPTPMATIWDPDPVSSAAYGERVEFAAGLPSNQAGRKVVWSVDGRQTGESSVTTLGLATNGLLGIRWSWKAMPPGEHTIRAAVEGTEDLEWTVNVSSPACAPTPAAVSDERPLIVLVHGLFGDRDSLARLRAALEEEMGPENVLAVEYRPSSGDGILDAALDVQEQISKELGDPPTRSVVLVGHSMGGLVARALLSLGCQTGYDIDDPRLIDPDWAWRIQGIYQMGTPNGGTTREFVLPAADAFIRGDWGSYIDDLVTGESPFLDALPLPEMGPRRFVNVMGDRCDGGDCAVTTGEMALGVEGTNSDTRTFAVCHSEDFGRWYGQLFTPCEKGETYDGNVSLRDFVRDDIKQQFFRPRSPTAMQIALRPALDIVDSRPELTARAEIYSDGATEIQSLVEKPLPYLTKLVGFKSKLTGKEAFGVSAWDAVVLAAPAAEPAFDELESTTLRLQDGVRDLAAMSAASGGVRDATASLRAEASEENLAQVRLAYAQAIPVYRGNAAQLRMLAGDVDGAADDVATVKAALVEASDARVVGDFIGSLASGVGSVEDVLRAVASDLAGVASDLGADAETMAAVLAAIEQALAPPGLFGIPGPSVGALVAVFAGVAIAAQRRPRA